MAARLMNGRLSALYRGWHQYCDALHLDPHPTLLEALREPMHLAEQADPGMAEGFRRLRTAKQQHREVLLDMLVKSDPYTLEPKRARKIPRDFNQGVTPCGRKRS
jgi:hypothetical protein